MCLIKVQTLNIQFIQYARKILVVMKSCNVVTDVCGRTLKLMFHLLLNMQNLCVNHIQYKMKNINKDGLQI